ncbi:MAG TPA: hypothetical protein VLR29_11970 [Flavobacterium sp.]|nr:hypothetical protein [Flavobacterium sp.]
MYLKKKVVCGSLIFAFLMQSCNVYQKTPVSIPEAAIANRKVVITKTDNTKQKFRKIEQIDGRYFGIIKANGNLVNVPIVESEIKSIRPLNKRASTLGTFGIFSGVVLVVLSIIGINAANDAAKQMITFPSIP